MRSTSIAAGVLALSVLAVAFEPQARADGSPADIAAAEALFAEGKMLMGQDRFTEACPKFAESRRLDPAPGTLLNLGDCYEKIGQTASALGAFNEAEATAKHDGDRMGRGAEAARRAKLLEPKLSKLVIHVPPSNQAPGLEVRRDGRTIGRGMWGTGIPVDPGAHVVEASAPGRTAWKTVVAIEAKPGLTTIAVPGLALAPIAEPAALPTAGVGAGADPGWWSTQRTVALAVGGVGVVGVVLGTVFGVQVLEKKSEAEDHCRADDPSLCNATGVALLNDVETAGNVSTAAFVIGGAALAGGVVLFLTAPATGKATGREAPRLEVAATGIGSGAGLTIRRRW